MGWMEHIHLTGRFTCVLMADGRYRACIVLDQSPDTARVGTGETPADALEDAFLANRE
jgi:hypothetical protein